jgi:hypothetical protein
MSNCWYAQVIYNNRFKEIYGKDIDAGRANFTVPDGLITTLGIILGAVGIYSFSAILAPLLPLLWGVMKAHPQITASLVTNCVKDILAGKEPEKVVKDAGIAAGGEAFAEWLNKLNDNISNNNK